MKTTLYEASESVKVLNQFSEQILPGRISLKIYDDINLLLSKGSFLEQEIRKIFDSYGAVPFDPDNNDSRMVIKDEAGDVDEEKTQEFVEKVIELRKTEVDLDIDPFTEDDLDIMKIKPVDLARIRWMIDREA